MLIWVLEVTQLSKCSLTMLKIDHPQLGVNQPKMFNMNRRLSMLTSVSNNHERQVCEQA